MRNSSIVFALEKKQCSHLCSFFLQTWNTGYLETILFHRFCQLLLRFVFMPQDVFKLLTVIYLDFHSLQCAALLKEYPKQLPVNKKHFITFPCGLAGQQVKQEFSTIRGFPGVIGCIDCTHIPISSPGGDNAEIFRNRKGFFRLMCKQFVTLICLSPTSYAVGQAPHMIAAFLIIALYALKFENNLIDGLLLGDGGYPCRHYFMTPVNNPVTAKEKNYNKAHIATRGKVERMFGVWKQRFRCLRIPLRMHLENSLTVIVSTACLHNFAIDNGDFIEEEPEVAEESIIMNSSSGTLSGNSARQRIIDNFFLILIIAF